MRKLLHIAFGVIFIYSYVFLERLSLFLKIGYEKLFTIYIISIIAVTVLFVSVEILRKKFSAINKPIVNNLSNILNLNETHKISSATFFLIGVLFCIILYPKKIAICSIAYLTFGDSVSSLISMCIGKIKINHKNISGLITTLIVNFLITLLFFSFAIAVLISILTVLIDLFSDKQKHLDDNLTIPIISGFFLDLIVNVL